MLKVFYNNNGCCYKINETVDEIALAVLPDGVCCAEPLFFEYNIKGEAVIENDRIYLTKASFSINGDDLQMVEEKCPYKFEKNKTLGKNFKTSLMLWHLSFSHLHIPLAINGVYDAHQYYSDEKDRQEGKTHAELCRLKFNSGVFSAGDSELTCFTERYIDRFIWREEYRGQKTEGCDTHRLYYINPKASVADYNRLMAIVTSCFAHGKIEESLIDKYLENKNPVMWGEYMSELEPGGGEYKKVVCDLPLTCIILGDEKIFKKIASYIDFSSDWCYTKRLLLAVHDYLESAYQTDNTEGIRCGIEILKTILG